MSDSEKPKCWTEHKQSIKHKWLVPFTLPGWLCGQLSYFLNQLAFLRILGHIGRLIILVGVIYYFMGADERRIQAEDQRKAKHYQAWQVINTAYGKPGTGGRVDALQDLHRDGISLFGVDLSGAFLPELRLTKATLRQTNFAGANLYRANLAGADLRQASLAVAKLSGVNLTGANLRDASLIGADLGGVDLAGADLWGANLAGANIHGANLTGADLRAADLAGANMWGADLTRANLWGVDLSGAALGKVNLENIQNWRAIKSMKQAKLYAIENPPAEFIAWATAPEQGAVLIQTEDEWNKLIADKRQEQTR